MSEIDRRVKYRESREEFGLCPQCGDEKENPDAWACERCKRRDRVLKRRKRGHQPNAKTGMGRPIVLPGR